MTAQLDCPDAADASSTAHLIGFLSLKDLRLDRVLAQGARLYSMDVRELDKLPPSNPQGDGRTAGSDGGIKQSSDNRKNGGSLESFDSLDTKENGSITLVGGFTSCHAATHAKQRKECCCDFGQCSL